jgi:transcriptional regulator GlxA family with amidase domain
MQQATDQPADQRLIVMLVYPGVMTMDVFGPLEAFATANHAAGRPLYRLEIAGMTKAPVATSLRGVEITPTIALDDIAGPIDTLLVSGGFGQPEASADQRLLAWLRSNRLRARRCGSICTGAFVLAAAGLLDDRPATTHWMHAPAFRRLFPSVRLDPGVLFVDDGEVLTSAGNAAGIDLLLHLVRRDHGSEVANRAARRNVVAPWREGGQSQFVERPLPESGEAGTAATRAWAADRLSTPLTLADLAGHARMSVRTFTRRFREETGLSPLRWLAGQRLALARQLLESTDAPIDRVAVDAGFGTPASLRQHLRASIGVAPGTYRRAYRGNGVTGHSPG